MTTLVIDRAPQAEKPSKPANMREQRDFDKARLHSRLVFCLKGILPLAALSCVVLFIASSFYSYIPAIDMNVEAVDISQGNLVMNKPKMAGFDKDGNPYAVRATKAIQSLKNPSVVHLKEIDAKLPMDAKSTAQVDADKGVYDTNKETIRLIDNVRVSGARGMDIKLQEADIDIKTGLMVSNKPVEVVSKDTKITSNSLVVENNGERIVFKERVRMTIIKPISRGEAKAQTSN